MSSAAPWRLAWFRFRRHPTAVAGLVLLIALASAAAAAPGVAALLGVDPNAVNLFNRFAPPTATHLLGTDELGRDVFVRLLIGGRASLTVGLCAALASAALGTLAGLFAGYFGGLLDAVLMRLTDALLALPLLPLLIVLAALSPAKLGLPADLANSPAAAITRIVVIVSLFGWTTVARLVRAQALHLRTETFVLAARAQGAGTARILAVHILPNLASAVVVATTLAAGNVILLESVLSFLGLGITPPTPSWGNLLTNAQELIWTAPMLAIWPGLLILLTVVALNVVGDGLREALDPRGPSR